MFWIAPSINNRPRFPVLSIQLARSEDDASGFVAELESLFTGAVRIHRPSEFYIIKIDNWFSHKWLGFSGKTLGAAGLWMKRLTVPPFVANRIVSQRHYVYNQGSDNYDCEGIGREVHHQGSAQANLRRAIKNIASEAALFWYSGNSAVTGRGSAMGYIPIDGEHWPWFLAFNQESNWRIVRRKGIYEYEVRRFREAAEFTDNIQSANQE